MNINDLEEKIKYNKINEAVAIIEEIGREKDNESVPFLIKHLQDTDNHLLRNEIALALSSISNPEAIDPIVKMIIHPKTKGYRGTLLAALEPFDYLPHFEMLVDFLYNGNFEVSRKSYVLIKKVVDGISDEMREKCVTKIKKEINVLEEKIDFLSESLKLFVK